MDRNNIFDGLSNDDEENSSEKINEIITNHAKDYEPINAPHAVPIRWRSNICVCGWTSPIFSSPDKAIDEMEKHVKVCKPRFNQKYDLSTGARPCTRCGLMFSIDEFSRRKNGLRASTCRSCISEIRSIKIRSGEK